LPNFKIHQNNCQPLSFLPKAGRRLSAMMS
jgi:hypothetical protein